MLLHNGLSNNFTSKLQCTFSPRLLLLREHTVRKQFRNLESRKSLITCIACVYSPHSRPFPSLCLCPRASDLFMCRVRAERQAHVYAEPSQLPPRIHSRAPASPGGAPRTRSKTASHLTAASHGLLTQLTPQLTRRFPQSRVDNSRSILKKDARAYTHTPTHTQPACCSRLKRALKL